MPLTFFDVLLAVIVGGSALMAGAFGFVRISRADVFDKYSAGALIYCGTITALAGYLAT